MASLRKRNNYYSIVFATRVDGKLIQKAYSLGTRYKKIAEQKRIEYEKLYQAGEINPFDDNWNLQEYEKMQDLEGTSVLSPIMNSLQKQFLKEKTNVTEKTKRTYKYIIRQFMDQVGHTMPVTRITADDIRNFCLRDKLANASKKNYLKHLKAFFNWVVEKEFIESNPCDKINLPKTRDNLVDKIIEEKDLNIIFKKFRDYQLKHKKARAIQSTDQMQLWFKPLITLAFYTGLRRKEIVQLRWEHVHLKEQFLRVTDTKNGQERTVPIFDPLYWRLKAWRKLMGNPKKGLVFPSPKSNSKLEIPMTGDNVSKRFKFYATEEADLKDTINFHGLRHSCATFLLRNGFNVIEVKNMLGHKSLEVTNRYVHLVAKDLLATANKNGLIKDKSA
ncbi:tyrosine-type recombinase/integrase [Aliifodinibius sp. S!AR15-10]|uniref:tyrosine-type recombinase/integrase n=1 Tax=Aliifodinibius sp. S!AR15-10 TaxID=2950437 RepID=UPI002866ED8A|nr:integrase [Aliifodinibius sp. S!AR15-10]MDR8392963.1 tyrosine-type recombinase/integrase [Aliifodinibius sp. S!AR15-10]